MRSREPAVLAEIGFLRSEPWMCGGRLGWSVAASLPETVLGLRIARKTGLEQPYLRVEVGLGPKHGFYPLDSEYS